MGTLVPTTPLALERSERTVLVVDDDDRLRGLFSSALEDAGYVARSASTATEAFAAIAATHPDVVILDVDLGGSSGLTLLDYLAVSFPETAVVMATGNLDRDLPADTAARGADRCLLKPISLTQLVAAVDSALVRREQADLDNWLCSQTIACLVRVAYVRDEATGHHGSRMSRFCAVLARELGFDERQCLRIQLASLLHDIGKIAINDQLLHKPGSLTAAERLTMETHAQIGWTVLSGFADETLQLAAQIAHDHHERWDGAGYPRGLAGTEIALEARIASVADVFDALTSDRPYRARFSNDEARAIIFEGRGTSFDPDVVDALLSSQEILRISSGAANDTGPGEGRPAMGGMVGSLVRSQTDPTVPSRQRS